MPSFFASYPSIGEAASSGTCPAQQQSSRTLTRENWSQRWTRCRFWQHSPCVRSRSSSPLKASEKPTDAPALRPESQPLAIGLRARRLRHAFAPGTQRSLLRPEPSLDFTSCPTRPPVPAARKSHSCATRRSWKVARGIAPITAAPATTRGPSRTTAARRTLTILIGRIDPGLVSRGAVIA